MAPPRWITRAQAGELLGVSVDQVSHIIRAGLLDSRRQSGPGMGSLRPRQVHALAKNRAREREGLERRKAEPHPDLRPKPPDTDQDWLTLARAA